MSLFIKSQGQGNPLILLHGWGFNGEIWNPLVPQLGRRANAEQVDLPGHGRSSYCEYTLPVLIETFVAQLPPQAVWIGWSLGGLITMAMARWRPTWVRALLLVASSPRFVTAPDWPHAISPALLQQFSEQLQNDTEGTLQRFLAVQVRGSETARQQLRSLNTWLKQSGWLQPTALQAGLQFLQDTDLRPELAQIQCPALLCLGEYDTVVPAEMGQDCQRWWPNLRQECIPAAAHIPFLSHPQTFMLLVQNFLAQINLA